MNQTPVGSRAAAFASKDPPPGSSGYPVAEEEGVADLPCDPRSGDTPFPVRVEEPQTGSFSTPMLTSTQVE